MMENLTLVEGRFLELLRNLSEQQRKDVIRILEALQQSKA